MITPFSIRDSRQLRAFTGITEERFEKSEKIFEEVRHEDRRLRYEEDGQEREAGEKENCR